MLPVSLYCLFLIAASVFSNAYLVDYYSLQHILHHRISLSFELFFEEIYYTKTSRRALLYGTSKKPFRITSPDSVIGSSWCHSVGYLSFLELRHQGLFCLSGWLLIVLPPLIECHDIAEILLKVALNTINQSTSQPFDLSIFIHDGSNQILDIENLL